MKDRLEAYFVRVLFFPQAKYFDGAFRRTVDHTGSTA
jgi:hypothetical protein